jgi:hypothetical protein
VELPTLTGVAWLLAVGACYRLTLLVVADKITEPWRQRVLARGHALVELHTLSEGRFGGGTEQVGWTCGCGEWSVRTALDVDAAEDAHAAHVASLVADGGLRYLLTCPWCVSMYVAVLAVGSGLLLSSGWGWQLAAGALTASAVTGTWAERAAPG